MFWETNTQQSISPIGAYVERKKGKETKEYGFYMYEKEIWEVKVDISDFVLIDETYQLKWYNNKLKVYLKSNIITNKKKEEFVVNHDWDELYRGLYDPEVKPSWATLYRVLTILQWWQLVRLTLSPSAWKEFINMFVEEKAKDWSVVKRREYGDRYKYKMEVTGEEERESQFGPYKVPTFKLWKELSDKEIDEATEQAIELKKYLSSFIKDDASTE